MFLWSKLPCLGWKSAIFYKVFIPLIYLQDPCQHTCVLDFYVFFSYSNRQQSSGTKQRLTIKTTFVTLLGPTRTCVLFKKIFCCSVLFFTEHKTEGIQKCSIVASVGSMAQLVCIWALLWCELSGSGKWNEKVFTNTPINNYACKAIMVFYTLFVQNVSTLNWVLFRCSLQLNCHNNKKMAEKSGNVSSDCKICIVENIIVIYPTRIGSDLFFPPYFSCQLSLWLHPFI
jgi:hypothetical protein